MSSIIVWSVLLVFWVITGIYYVKRDKATFWPCWSFFFIGWTSSALVSKILELFS